MLFSCGYMEQSNEHVNLILFFCNALILVTVLCCILQDFPLPTWFIGNIFQASFLENGVSSSYQELYSGHLILNWN